MGGGTFFKGGTSARQKNYREFLWFDLATVTSQALKYHVITYTPYENVSVKGRPRSTASLGLIRFILTE